MKMEEQRYIVCSHFADSTSYAVPKQLTNLSFCTVLHTYSDRCNRPGAARVQKSGGLPQWVSLRRQCIGSISWQGSNVDTSCWTSTENRTSPPLMFGKIPPLNCRFLRDQLRSTFNQRCYNAYTREREREKTFGASRVSLFFVFVKKPCLSEMGTDVVSDPQSCSPSTSGRWRPSTKTLPQVDAGQCAAPVFSLKGPAKLSQGLMLYTHKGCNFPCSQAAEELPILQDWGAKERVEGACKQSKTVRNNWRVETAEICSQALFWQWLYIWKSRPIHQFPGLHLSLRPPGTSCLGPSSL